MSDNVKTAGGGSYMGRRICIVGAGIGGLTAALAFAQRGASVQVFEQAEALREVGAGVQITPNGARVLEALGLGPAMAVGVQAQAVVPMDALSGRVVARFDLSHQSPAYRFYHRADLVGVLAEGCRAAGVEIYLSSYVEDIDKEGNFTVNGVAMTSDLCVGADGIHAVSRIDATTSAFTGQVAWRAVIDANTDAAAQIWMAPKRHVVTYPLSGGRLNIVAVQERDDWADEGWHHADDPANLRAAFADSCLALRGILDQVEACQLWGLFRHPVATKWYDGRRVILGDAAHPTLPFLAQGANMAIEDAWCLAACCDGDINAGLARYQAQRQPRVTRAIAAANANARNYHLSGLQRFAAHIGLKTLGKVAPDAFLKRMDWLYGYDVTKDV